MSYFILFFFLARKIESVMERGKDAKPDMKRDGCHLSRHKEINNPRAAKVGSRTGKFSRSAARASGGCIEPRVTARGLSI